LETNHKFWVDLEIVTQISQIHDHLSSCIKTNIVNETVNFVFVKKSDLYNINRSLSEFLTGINRPLDLFVVSQQVFIALKSQNNHRIQLTSSYLEDQPPVTLNNPQPPHEYDLKKNYLWYV